MRARIVTLQTDKHTIGLRLEAGIRETETHTHCVSTPALATCTSYRDKPKP